MLGFWTLPIYQHISYACTYKKPYPTTSNCSENVSHLSTSQSAYFIHCFLKEQWFAGWELQRAAKCARSCFNGCLAKYAALYGSYIINHPNITGEDDSMYLEDGSLSSQGHIEFLMDIQREISKCDRLAAWRS